MQVASKQMIVRSVSLRLILLFASLATWLGCSRPSSVPREGVRLFQKKEERANQVPIQEVIHLMELDFEDKSELDNLKLVGSAASATVSAGTLHLEIKDVHSFLVIPLHRGAEEANLFSIRFRMVDSPEGKAFPKLYWTTPSEPNGSEENALTTAQSPTKAFSVIHFPLCQSLGWKGRIDLLRFHPSVIPGRFEIDSIRISRANYPAIHCLTTGNPRVNEATIGSDTRPATLCPAPRRLTQRLVPGPSTFLKFAFAVHPYHWTSLKDEVEARILLKRTFSDEILFSETLDPAKRQEDRRWVEGKIDLSRFAGKRIDLVFSVTSGDPEPWAIWSCPRLVHTDPKDRASKPNLVLVSVDTLRADHLGTYGYRRATSPCLDQMAEDGTLFEKVLSQASWTLPSHMSLFTSLYPAQHEVHTPNDRKDPSTRSVVEAFKNAGYHTIGITEGGFTSHRWGLSQGFDSYFEFTHPPNQTSRVVDRAKKVLSQTKDEAVFLFLHTFETHDYWKWEELSEKALAVLPSFLPRDAEACELPAHELLRRLQADATGAKEFDEAEGKWLLAMYDARIASADQALGRLREMVDCCGDTILAVTSDHGEEFEEHGGRHHGNSHHRELLHVPLILYGPGVERGLRRKELTRLVDVLPLLSKMAQAPIPWTISGAVPNQDREPEMSAAQTTFPLMNPAHNSLTRGSWRYIYNHDRDREYLYRWDKDPLEQTDLSQDRPEEIKAFRRQLVRAVCASEGYHLLLFGDTSLDVWVTIRSETPFNVMQGLFLDPDGYDLSSFPETIVFRSRLSRGMAGLRFDVSQPAKNYRILVETPSGTVPVTRLAGHASQSLRFWALKDEPALPSELDNVLTRGKWKKCQAFLLERKGRTGTLPAAAINPTEQQALRDLGYLQ